MSKNTGLRRRLGLSIAAAVAFGLVMAGSSVWMGLGKDAVQDAVVLEPSGTAADDLARAGELRIFFGHQSVGENILSGVRALYGNSSQTEPQIVESSEKLTLEGSFLQHALIGHNGDPAGKIRDFAKILDAGTGDNVQVAMMKLCYIDFNADTDVDELFRLYSETVDALQAKYPNVRFLHATAPLTEEPGLTSTLKSTAKAWLRGRLYSTPENVVREKYNNLVRAKYGSTGRLLDIAAWEALRSDGSLTAKSAGGVTFLSLNPSLASDGAHLNDEGAKQLAGAFLHVVAEQQRQ